MLTRTYSVVRNLYKIDKRLMSSSVNREIAENRSAGRQFLTKETNPANHNESHIAKLYTIPKSVITTLQLNVGVEQTMRRQMNAFGKLSLVIRKPAVELIGYLEQADYKKPINKYVVYGERGMGKTTMLFHILHYAYVKEYVILHAIWPHDWYIYPKEIAPSPLQEGMFDLPVDAAEWLKRFMSENKDVMTKLNLKTTKEYVWSSQDITPIGTSLMELVDFGINRIKFACGVVNSLVSEIKEASTNNKCKTLVIVDGFNAFLSKYTSIRDNKRVIMPAESITLTAPFMNITKFDWCNGAAVLTVDSRAVKDAVDSSLPGHLLGTEGFEHLDPFVPLKLTNYTDEEFNNIIDYYEERRMIKPMNEKNRAELKAVSDACPGKLWRYCAYL